MSDSENKTILAIDYGRRRVGLAKSDPMAIIATAVDTIEVKSDQQALEKIVAAIKEYQPAALVLGYPLSADGSVNESCRRVDSFIARLKEVYDGSIHKVNEFGTSQEAVAIIHAHGKKAGKKKKRIDRLAAVLILQRFLDDQG